MLYASETRYFSYWVQLIGTQQKPLKLHIVVSNHLPIHKKVTVLRLSVPRLF